MRPPTERTDRWYANISTAKTKNGTWARSSVEDRFAQRFIEQGIKIERNLNVGRYAIDIALVEHRIAVEVDGTRHLGREVHDNKRDAFLRSQGWTVVRVSVTNGRSTGRHLIPRLLRELGLIGQTSHL